MFDVREDIVGVRSADAVPKIQDQHRHDDERKGRRKASGRFHHTALLVNDVPVALAAAPCGSLAGSAASGSHGHVRNLPLTIRNLGLSFAFENAFSSSSHARFEL